LLKERPLDSGEEVEELLRGWMSYYGSFAGIELPEAVRARAAALEGNRAESTQLGKSAPVMGPPPTGDLPPPAGQAAEPSRWARAAIRLAAAQGSGEEGQVFEEIRKDLTVDAAAWLDLAAALARFDGGEAAEILARSGRYGDAIEAAEIVPPPQAVAQETASAADGGGSAVNDDATERPRFEPQPADAQRLIDLFGGAEHLFFRNVRDGGEVRQVRVDESPTIAYAREHLAGTYRWGCFRCAPTTPCASPYCGYCSQPRNKSERK
jgi:hypothetical protein